METKPSVTFFNRVYPPVRGATGRILRDLARAFVRDGWDVTVITMGPQNVRERDGSIRVVRLKSYGTARSIFSAAWQWFRMCRAGMKEPRSDLIVTMTDPPMLVAAGRMIAQKKRCKHIHWCQDLYPDLLPMLGVPVPESVMEFLKGISRRSMKRSDRVVVIGRCMAKYITHNGMDPQRVTVIPNWPDLELTDRMIARRRAAAANANTDEDDAADEEENIKPYEALFRDMEPKFRVLYSGNLGRAHPIQTVLESAAILQKSNPEIEFVFVGDGPQFDRLAQERVRRGLQNIRFLPWQPASRLRELMESGDVHLISMNDQVTGMLVPSKLYGALAVGRPCILVGPDTCETARIIRDYKAGSIVPQGEPRQLADAILKYRTDGTAWFAAHEGAAKAGKVFVPEESFKAWIERARNLTGTGYKPVRGKTGTGK